MITFIDNRAAALGITGTLTTDQRIALDLNTQVEKLGLKVAALSAALTASQVNVINVTATGLDLTAEMWKIAQVIGLGGNVTITPLGVFSMLPPLPVAAPAPA